MRLQVLGLFATLFLTHSITIFFFSSIASASTDFALDAGTVRINHNRPDLNLEKLWLSTSCFNADGSWAENDCASVEVNGQQPDGIIEFPADSNNKDQIPTPKISIRYHENTGKIFCIGMKVLFYGYPNQTDYALYSDLKDRYSLLSFCTVTELPEALQNQPRVSHRRSDTWSEFVDRFLQPIDLQLKQ